MREVRVAGQAYVGITNRGEIMATWITHLRISEGILEKCNIPNPSDFLIGAVAPDSGKLNDDNYTYTPPSDVSHFSREGRGKWQAVDCQFYKRYIIPDINKNEEYSSFLMGYLSHLLTDVLWGHFVYYPTKAKYSAELKDKLFVWEIKKDWFENDFEFLNNKTIWNIWAIFEQARYVYDILDYYPKNTINEKINSIKEYYSIGISEKAPGRYLSKADNEKFIDKAIEILVYALANIEFLYENVSDTIFENLEKHFGELNRDHIWIGDL